MEMKLQVDHQPIQSDVMSNAPSGVVVRALLTIAGAAPAGTNRPPLGLAFVIDRSGSMSGAPIEAARMAVARAVERLHPDDVVSVVAFDGAVLTIAPPEPRHRHQQLVERLLSLDVGGATNLSGGWLRGREHMQQARGTIGDLAGSSRRIVLLTDGHANQGITDVPTLVELARTARTMGITTTTIGLGAGYDDALLRGMADAGGGNAWYIERPDQSADVFAEELGALLSVAAQGLTVSVTLSEAVTMAAVHSDWPCTDSAAGVRTFDLGDLYAAEPKPLLLELYIPAERLAAFQGAAAAIATLTVTANVITADGGVEHRTLHLPLAASLEGQQHVEPAIEEAVLLAKVARARTEAAQRQRLGDADGAADAMSMALDALQSSDGFADGALPESLAEAMQDMQMLERSYRAYEFSELDAKYQMQRSYNARRGKRSYDSTLSRRPDDA